MDTTAVREIDTVVVGGGQAGLVVGHELADRGRDFVILDAGERVGDAWRNRWDSLVLFTPARNDGLPGMPFPGEGGAFVTKDEVADFLEAYAQRMALPVKSATRVDRVVREGDRFVVTSGRSAWRANNVVVAMADYQVPKVPEFAPDLDPDIVQMHASQYRNPAQLGPGDVLVVGLGNSGADIGLELARTRPTWIAGKEPGVIPFRIERRFGRWVGVRLVRFMAVRVLNTSTPVGRKARPRMLFEPSPLVRVKPKDLQAAGARRVPRVVGVRHGLPELADGRLLDVGNVIWCTGYRPGFSWIDLPVFDEHDTPVHERGVVPTQPGLYFVGLYFLHSLWSETITGMVVDARYVVDHLDRRTARVPVGATT